MWLETMGKYAVFQVYRCQQPNLRQIRETDIGKVDDRDEASHDQHTYRDVQGREQGCDDRIDEISGNVPVECGPWVEESKSRLITCDDC